MAIRAFELCANTPWAILPENLHQIMDIAYNHSIGERVDIEALEEKLGRRLDNTHAVTVREGVAIIPVTGPIMRYGDFFSRVSGGQSLDTLATDLREAIDNPSVHSILLNIDSPGGEAAGIHEFAQQVRAGSESKRIVTYTGNLAASAGYWIAAAAEEIYADLTARVGSIGVVASIRDKRKADEKAGITNYEFVSSQSPRKRPDPSSEEGRTDIQAVIDDLAGVFVEDIATFRGVTAEDVVSNFAQGGTLIASKALEAGMIDGISSFESVLQMLISKDGEPTSNPGRKNKKTTEAKAMAEEQKTTKPEAEEQAPVATAETLRADHGNIVAEIEANAAKAERDRIKSIYSAMTPAFVEQAEKAMFEECSDAGAFALDCLAVHKKNASENASALPSDRAKPLEQTSADDIVVEGDASEKTDAEESDPVKAKWDSSKDLQAEFQTFGAFKAYADRNPEIVG